MNERIIKKMCMLEENKICDDCLNCDTCDLDPAKTCDNCAKCIETNGPYRSIQIKDIVYAGDSKKPLKLIETKPIKESRV